MSTVGASLPGGLAGALYLLQKFQQSVKVVVIVIFQFDTALLGAVDDGDSPAKAVGERLDFIGVSSRLFFRRLFL